jgi:hypothetical protein
MSQDMRLSFAFLKVGECNGDSSSTIDTLLSSNDVDADGALPFDDD